MFNYNFNDPNQSRYSIMKDARAQPSSNKGQKANFSHVPSAPPMNRLFKFQLKLFISGAYKSKTKNGFVAFMRIIDLQKEIHYSLIHSCCV